MFYSIIYRGKDLEEAQNNMKWSSLEGIYVLKTSNSLNVTKGYSAKKIKYSAYLFPYVRVFSLHIS